MTHPAGLSQWVETVSIHMPHLSKPVATVLALWSFGMVMTKSCGLTTVAGFLADLLKQPENTVRQRLREWCRDAEDKQGEKRRQLDVAESFVPLIGWVLSYWPSTEKRLALAMDATTLAQLFTVLTVSVVYRGCAIPVAWVILPATAKGAWKTHWLDLFQHLCGSIGPDWTVIVLADRGLYAQWLYRKIVALGWHPYLRINANGKFRLPGAAEWHLLAKLVPQVGSAWCGQVICFKERSLNCTVLTCWQAGYADPWLIITDLTPEQADVCWYSLRTWIECGFKDTKRGGWQWQQTRMTDPERASRLWLAIALATLWVVSVGGEADATLPASSLDALPETHIARRRSTQRARPRLLSCFRRGILLILASIIAGAPRLCGRFYPEPWPSDFVQDTSGLFAQPRPMPALQETYP
jgi:hypothetical protein